MIRKNSVQQLTDLDVDRVDGVDRPATGRNFLLFKSKALLDPALKAAGRVSFASVMFPIEEQPVRTGPRAADEGEDALGRRYSDEVYATLGGMNSVQPDTSPIPAAGHAVVFEGDSRDVPDSGARFSPGQGGRLVKPTQEYRHVEPTAPTRVGPNFVMNPQNSGLATPLDFKAPAPTEVLKDERMGRGLFEDVVLGPESGPSRTGNFFDRPRVTKSAKPLGEGLFSSIIGQEDE